MTFSNTGEPGGVTVKPLSSRIQSLPSLQHPAMLKASDCFKATFQRLLYYRSSMLLLWGLKARAFSSFLQMPLPHQRFKSHMQRYGQNPSKSAWVIKPEFLVGEREDVSLCSSISAVTETCLFPQMITKLSTNEETPGSVIITSISEEEVVTSCVWSKVRNLQTPLAFKSQIQSVPLTQSK